MGRERGRVILHGLTCCTLVLLGSACQGDGAAGDDTDSTTTQESTTVTEPNTGSTTPPGSPDPTEPTTSDATDPGDSSTTPTAASSTVPLTLSTDVFATTPPVKTAPPSATPVGFSETVYDVGMIDDGLAPFITIAAADLAERLSIDERSIATLTAVIVTWPDGALGCPEPDRVYTQVLTDGSVIELGVDDRVYRYHSGGNRTPFLCDRPLNPAPTPQ